MTYEPIKFRTFLQENGISSYFLHYSIKKKIQHFEQQVLLYNATDTTEGFPEDFIDILTRIDEEIQQSIRAYLIKKVRRKATNDKEILIALKKLKWVKGIKESELRAMGLEASLFWSTTILGKLKLVRITANHITLYYLLPIGKPLKIDDYFENHQIIRTPIIEEPV